MKDAIQAVLDRQDAYQKEQSALRIMKDRTWIQMRRTVRERLGLPQLPEDMANDNDD